MSPDAQRRASTPRATLMLVDDHPIWRETLARMLRHKRAGTVVAQASDGQEAIVLARKARPEVVIMDIDLPLINGVEATRRLVEEQPGIKVLVLSASDSRGQVIEAVRAGASGYLIKTAGPDEVVAAVHRIHAGELVFPPAVAEAVLGEIRRAASRHLPDRTSGPDPLEALTDPEREVLALMAEGRSNQAIGSALHCSSKTVEARVGSIFAKLGLEPAADDHRRVLAVVTYLRSL